MLSGTTIEISTCSHWNGFSRGRFQAQGGRNEYCFKTTWTTYTSEFNFETGGSWLPRWLHVDIRETKLLSRRNCSSYKYALCLVLKDDARWMYGFGRGPR
jgi:hypothetical protein